MNFPRVKDRLPAPYGALIDRARPITFTFEGMSLNAFQGDTIASALAAKQARWLREEQRPRNGNLVSWGAAQAEHGDVGLRLRDPSVGHGCSRGHRQLLPQVRPRRCA